MGKGNTFFSFFRIFAPIIWIVYKKIVNMTPTTKRVFQIFKELNQIPRPSHHEERVADYLCQFAERLGLTYKRDKENCVVISKPATPGHEGAEPIVLLNHMDMVCVGMSDPLNDPIQAYVEDGWMKARGTSLGADNGIGLSMALAVLESNDIVHGPMEVITTTNEEDGMSGASQLSSDFLRGRNRSRRSLSAIPSHTCWTHGSTWRQAPLVQHPVRRRTGRTFGCRHQQGSL